MNKTPVALDSCVVIDMLEKPAVASGLKARLRGKSVRIILCDIVLNEVRRVRGYLPRSVIAKISALLGRKVDVSHTDKSIHSHAQQITDRLQICHGGDNKILSQCRAKGFVLVTFDRDLLTASQIVGVAGFHPSAVRGI